RGVAAARTSIQCEPVLPPTARLQEVVSQRNRRGCRRQVLYVPVVPPCRYGGRGHRIRISSQDACRPQRPSRTRATRRAADARLFTLGQCWTRRLILRRNTSVVVFHSFSTPIICSPG